MRPSWRIGGGKGEKGLAMCSQGPKVEVGVVRGGRRVRNEGRGSESWRAWARPA